MGLIPIRVKPKTLKLVLTAFLLDAQHQGDNVKNKPASLLVPLPVRKGITRDSSILDWQTDDRQPLSELVGALGLSYRFLVIEG